MSSAVRRKEIILTAVQISPGDRSGECRHRHRSRDDVVALSRMVARAQEIIRGQH